MKRLFFFLPTLLLAGCVYLPLPTSTPYLPEVTAPLEAGHANRVRVREVLGSGYVSRMGGKYWFYGDVQVSAIHSVGQATGETYVVRWLAVRFDSTDSVDKIWRMDAESHCTPTGICLERDGFKYIMFGLCRTSKCNLDNARPKIKEGWNQLTLSAVLTAPSEMDVAAKRLDKRPNQCGVYVYSTNRTKTPWLGGFLLDNNAQVAVSKSTYALIWVEPGEHVIIDAFARKTPKKRLRFKCAPSATLFIDARHEGPLSNAMVMHLVDAQEGEAALAQRSLRLPM